MKRAGLLPANGPAGHRARCPAAPLPGEGKGAALSQPRRAPGSCKDTSETQKGHSPRTALRARHRPPLTAEPHGGDLRRAPRNRAKRRWGRTTAPSPKLPSSQATPVAQAGYRQGGTRLPAAVPDRVPCAPSHGPAWETRLCRRLGGFPTPAPNTARSKRPRLPGGKPSKTTPNRHRKPNNLVPAAFPLEKGGRIQTGKQGKRLNPRQLQCCYTNHDSSHMLAASGAPAPPPRSPRSGQAMLAVHPGRAAGNRKRPGPVQDRGQAGGGAAGPRRGAAGTSVRSLRDAAEQVPPSPGTRGRRLTAPGSRGAALGEASAAAGGDPPPCLTLPAAPIPRRRGWAHSRSGGGFVW